MEETLIQRRKKLNEEIELASKLLEENLHKASIKDYISFGTGFLPGAIHGIVDNPSKTISTGDMISRTILPQRNIIRQLFKYLSLIKRGYKLITNKYTKL